MDNKQRIQFAEEILKCSFLCEKSRSIVENELKSLLPVKQRCNIAMLKSIREKRKAPIHGNR